MLSSVHVEVVPDDDENVSPHIPRTVLRELSANNVVMMGHTMFIRESSWTRMRETNRCR